MLVFSPLAGAGSCYNNAPPPVACFTGSATQALPFQGWSLNSLYSYAYYYYPSIACGIRYYYYYTCYSISWIKCWARNAMIDEWRAAGCVECT